jgi:hypothetical protein
MAQSTTLTNSLNLSTIEKTPAGYHIHGGSGERITPVVRQPETSFAFLRMGDLVVLQSSEFEGYLCSEGFTDPSCSLRSPEPGQLAPRDAGEAVFEVLPRFRYESRSALVKYQENQRFVGDDEDETLQALQHERGAS